MFRILCRKIPFDQKKVTWPEGTENSHMTPRPRDFPSVHKIPALVPSDKNLNIYTVQCGAVHTVYLDSKNHITHCLNSLNKGLWKYFFFQFLYHLICDFRLKIIVHAQHGGLLIKLRYLLRQSADCLLFWRHINLNRQIEKIPQ